MSRAVIFDALTTDSALNAVGINQFSVFPNYTLETRPPGTGPWLILRWQDNSVAFRNEDGNDVEGPRGLAIWAHYPIELGDDFVQVDDLLTLCRNAIKTLADVPGTDGVTLTSVRSMGRGPDIKDEGFQTVTRYETYEILSRPS